MPAEFINSLTVHRRLRNRYFVLEVLGRSKEFGWLTPTGERIQLNHDEMKSRGLSLILKLLRKPNRFVKAEHSVKVTPTYLKFLHDHEQVSVTLLSNDRLRLSPMSRLRGGRFVGERPLTW